MPWTTTWEDVPPQICFRVVWLESSLTKYRNPWLSTIHQVKILIRMREWTCWSGIFAWRQCPKVRFFFFVFFFVLCFFFSRRALYSYTCKVNKRPQNLVQSHSHRAPNTKGKGRQIQKSSPKMNRRQAEFATLSQNSWERFLKKVGTLLPKLNWIDNQLTW